MRMVIFSKHDFEAMTVVNVPDHIIRNMTKGHGRSAFPLRLLPRLKPMPVPWTDDTHLSISIRVIDIWVEALCRRKPGRMPRSFNDCVRVYGPEQAEAAYEEQFMWTWVGYCDDDALDLQSVFLPGQEYDVQARERDAYYGGY